MTAAFARRASVAAAIAMSLAVAIAMSLAVGCARSRQPAARSVAAGGMRLDARDQASDGDRVVVSRLELSRPGYVVVRSDGGGAPGVVLGASSLLGTGEHRNVAVRLATPVEATTTVHLMIHVEENGNRELDYPQGDRPATNGARVLTLPVRLRGTS